MKKVLFILLGCLLSFNVMAQVKAISGLVTDVTGEPVIGASVVEVGTTNGVITDLNGKFSLKVAPNSQFLVSYIGYKQQTIKVGSESTYNIVLKEDAEVLDEVVVVGYGSQKKVNVTGAVGMVGAEALEARPVANASQALQGVVPGLNLTVGNNGGALDGTLNMNIRGAGTIGDGSGSSPLVLIDGIEGDLNTVNPNDIESVSVLKDAASASIYGARASFGVILVTTKSGKSGKTNVSYSGSARFSDAIGVPDIMDSYTFAQYFNRASANKGGGDIFAPAVMERIKAYQEGTLKATTVDNGAGIWQKWANANGDTDWFEEFYDHWAPSQEHNLSINGGTDKTQYLISGSFLDQKGLMRHGKDKFQRYTLNGKITTAVTDWFKVTYSTKWTREDFERPSYLTGVLRKLFPTLKLQEPEHMEAHTDFYTKEAAEDYLVFGPHEEAWYALARWFLQENDMQKQEKIRKLLHAPYTRYEGEPISRAVALALYGRHPYGSITRLERFAACAYAHFLQYGLKLTERETSAFESVDMGNIYHDALWHFAERIRRSSYTWYDLPEQTRETWIEESMNDAIAGCANVGAFDEAKNRYLLSRMKDTIRRTVWALTIQVQKGRFTPSDFEVSFSQADHLEAIRFQLTEEEKMRLRGRIDRVDTCETDDKVYVKIIDYKSGNTTFSLLNLYHGLQLQLVVYMNAALELEAKKHPGKQAVPAGMFYYHIEDPMVDGSGTESEEEIRQAVLEELKPNGLVNDDPEIYGAMDTELSGSSAVIPVAFKADGSLKATSKTASTEEFGTMSDYVKETVESKFRNRRKQVAKLAKPL